jgi:hypothetical protein
MVIDAGRRLLRHLSVEVSHWTKPDRFLAVGLALAAYAYKYFWGGGVQGFYSSAVPAIWVFCAFGCYVTVRSAFRTRTTEIAQWENEVPLIVGATKRPRPSVVPLFLVTLVSVGLFCVLFYGSLAALPDRAALERYSDRPRLHPVLVIDSLGDRQSTNFHLNVVNGPYPIREIQVAYSTGTESTFDLLPLNTRNLAAGEKLMVPGQLFTNLATVRRLWAIFSFHGIINDKGSEYTQRFYFVLPRGDITSGREFNPISKIEQDGNTLQAEFDNFNRLIFDRIQEALKKHQKK